MRSLSVRMGLVVRQQRLAANLSQEELANCSGLHRTYISLLERGLRNPSVDTVAKIASALNLSASQLLGNAEDHA